MSFLARLKMMAGKRARLGLALGSGGARGFAHIGVLKVLEEEKIPVHCIAGCSAGAIIGGLYSGGASVLALEDLAASFSLKEVAKLLLPSFNRGGLIDGGRVKRLLSPYTAGRSIESLSPRFACVSTDLYSGERIVFKEGDLLESIRASISIPGLFTPAICGDRILVDGGVADPLPIGLAYELGADFVIAVRVNRQVEHRHPLPRDGGGNCTADGSSELRIEKQLGEIEDDAGEDWLRNSLRKIVTTYEKARDNRRLTPPILEIILSTISIYERRLSELSIRDAKDIIVVEPALAGIEILDLHKGVQAIAAGEAAMRSRLGDVGRALG
ncbi:MAG: patatin-like phospholipase family protein [Proteobacteria bacterium]|nr:patatin-like phospholipase family protein [Pseudomonadota bacterium]